MQLKITLVNCVAIQRVRFRTPGAILRLVHTSVSPAAMSQSDKGSPLQQVFSESTRARINTELTEDLN